MALIQRWFFRNYDNASTTLTYGKFRSVVQGYGGVQTVGASTTVTAVTASIGTFSPVQVGDTIVFWVAEAPLVRRVTAKASNDSITVSSSVDLSALTGGYAAWYFWPFLSGTGAESGWIKVDDLISKTLYLQFTTVAATGGIDVQIQTRGGDYATVGVNTFPLKNYTAATDSEAIPIAEDAKDLRVGVCGHTDFSGTDDFTIYIEGNQRW